MRARILCISALMLCALGWATDRRTHVGEAVPDDVAAAERGGQVCSITYPCAPWAMTTCVTIPGTPCLATSVLAQIEGPPRTATCAVYCGNSSGSCVRYPTEFLGSCAGG
jgi:hypothetical protein